MKDNYNKLSVSIAIGTVANLVAIICIMVVNGIYPLFEPGITADNAGDYVGVIMSMISVVFITTSLLSTLSSREDTVYWENTIHYLLINPKYWNFYGLSVYAFVSMFFMIVGYFMKTAAVVLGSSLIIMICITVLFFRMTRVYFKRQNIRIKLEKEFRDLVAELDSIEDQNSEKYNILKNEFDDKISSIFMNTIDAVDNHQLTIIKENLELLLNIDEKSSAIDQVADVLLNIYQSIYERDKFLFVTAVKVYGNYGNICTLNDYLYYIVTSLENAEKENEPFKNTLCELYVDAMVRLQERLDVLFKEWYELDYPSKIIEDLKTKNANIKKIYYSYENGQICRRISIVTGLYEENNVSNIDKRSMFLDSADPVARAKGNALIRKAFSSYDPIHDKVFSKSPYATGNEVGIYGDNIYSDYLTRLVLEKPTKLLSFFRDFVDKESWMNGTGDTDTLQLKNVIFSQEFQNVLENSKKMSNYNQVVKAVLDELAPRNKMDRYAFNAEINEEEKTCEITVKDYYVELIERFSECFDYRGHMEIVGENLRAFFDRIEYYFDNYSVHFAEKENIVRIVEICDEEHGYLSDQIAKALKL